MANAGFAGSYGSGVAASTIIGGTFTSDTLNGNEIASLPTVSIDNFYYQSHFSAITGSLFNQGVNNLVFSIGNFGGQGAFRSGRSAYADLAP